MKAGCMLLHRPVQNTALLWGGMKLHHNGSLV